MSVRATGAGQCSSRLTVAKATVKTIKFATTTWILNSASGRYRAMRNLHGRRFDVAGAVWEVVQVVGTDAVTCKRVDHGTGQGRIGHFDYNWVVLALKGKFRGVFEVV